VPKGVLVVEFNLAESGHSPANAAASLIDATSVVNEVRLDAL
jgi:hypothetical protein